MLDAVGTAAALGALMLPGATTPAPAEQQSTHLHSALPLILDIFNCSRQQFSTPDLSFTGKISSLRASLPTVGWAAGLVSRLFSDSGAGCGPVRCQAHSASLPCSRLGEGIGGEGGVRVRFCSRSWWSCWVSRSHEMKKYISSPPPCTGVFLGSAPNLAAEHVVYL